MIVKEVFPVSGMSCTSCAARIEKAVKSTEGVKDASVNFSNSSVMVEYDDENMNPEKIQHTVMDIGYNITIESKETTQS